jgi:hypothetical protein
MTAVGRPWKRRIVVVLAALTLTGCEGASSVPKPEPAQGVVFRGKVIRDVAACTAETQALLQGSQLIITDPLGDTRTATLSGSCQEQGLTMEWTGWRPPSERPVAVVASYYLQFSEAQESYRFSFAPGPNFGDRPAPTSTQQFSLDTLDAANFRVDYDTGSDAPSGSSAGVGAVLPPRLCVGFPVPGCDP